MQGLMEPVPSTIADRPLPQLATCLAFPGGDRDAENIAEVLHVVRSHLGVDIAFISEFVGQERIFRYVDPPHNTAFLRIGQSTPLAEGFCKRIVDGDLPELMTDTSEVPAALAILSAAASPPVGSHLGVPIRLRDTQVYGSLCCFSGRVDRSLNNRDLDLLRALADLVGRRLDRLVAERRENGDLMRRIVGAIAGEGRSVVFQPIYRLADDRVVGLESLSRFAATPVRAPDTWFSDAQRIGRLAELEVAAMASGFAALGGMPADVHLAVNVSPSTLLADEVLALLGTVPAERVMLEITEHANVPDYAVLAARLGPLRRRGLKVAVDDAGAGYASLQHILNLRPDVIKLDMSLTRDIDSDPARRSMARALTHFAAEVGCDIVAEGIETQAERETLCGLRVTMGQGYGLCRPLPLPDVLGRIGQPGAADAA